MSVGAEYAGDGWRNALTALESMRRGTIERGFSQAEIDQALQFVKLEYEEHQGRVPVDLMTTIKSS